MTNEIQVFSHEQFGKIRRVIFNDKKQIDNNYSWFISDDITKALKYTTWDEALYHYVDDLDKEKSICEIDGERNFLVLINEYGVYSLIISKDTPLARKFRRWFTDEVMLAVRRHKLCETGDMVKEALNNPDAIIEIFTVLKEEREKNAKLTAKIERDKPKVIFANAVSESDTTILVGDLTKILRQNGIEIGQKQMFKWMRENDYLIKNEGPDWNMPTQRSMEMELFKIKETVIELPDGSTRVNKTTKVTGKGQIYFTNLFLKDKEPDVTIDIDPNVA